MLHNLPIHVPHVPPQSPMCTRPLSHVPPTSHPRFSFPLAQQSQHSNGCAFLRRAQTNTTLRSHSQHASRMPLYRHRCRWWRARRRELTTRVRSNAHTVLSLNIWKTRCLLLYSKAHRLDVRVTANGKTIDRATPEKSETWRNRDSVAGAEFMLSRARDYALR
jgi:hypothetical protein